MNIESLLEIAIKRKPKRLGFESTYTHDNLYNWLKTILPSWEIIIPKISCSSSIQSCAALSDWPATSIIRDEVKHWLEEKNVVNVDDFLDGACEPLAFYLSSKIKKFIEDGNFKSIDSCYQNIKSDFDSLKPTVAAEMVFGNYIKNEHKSPLFWGQEVIGSYMDYLFGNEVTKERILEKAYFPGINLLPLYILNYIFDNDELSTRELKTHSAETAQYSLHVVGLVFDFSRKRVIIADANGALIPGSNMEFLSMPLKTRKAKESTKVSRFDLDCRKRSSKVSEDISCDSNLPKRRKENADVIRKENADGFQHVRA